MANNVNNVSAGKPKVGGALFVAPIGTALPTDSVTALNAAFKGLGYVSEDGLVNSITRETDNVKAWGGDTVLSPTTSFEDTYQVTLIETVNIDTLKLIFGSDNVTVGTNGETTVTVNSNELDEWSFVAETLLRDGSVRRQVIPRAKVTELGEITYNDSDPVGYETTLTAYPDESGNTHYEYFVNA